MKAVRFEEYGGIDVLKVADVPRPVPGPDQVRCESGRRGDRREAKIREARCDDRWPTAFPSGQGSDLAGIVAGPGPGAPESPCRRRGHRIYR